jgi:uncharacterized protein (DUF302 family)
MSDLIIGGDLFASTRSPGSVTENQMNVPSTIQVDHVHVYFSRGFDEFTMALEKLLGRFDPQVASTFAKDPQLADQQLQKMEGEENLMIFQVLDHGGLFKLIGQTRKAKRYTVGNPRIAFQMTRHDIRAGLYVPFNVLVADHASNSVRVEYDRPSSLLDQFGSAEVSAVATQLDGKIERLIEKAANVPDINTNVARQ